MTAPTQTLPFTDSARLAAKHLLDSPFGERLRQVAWVTDGRGCLMVTYDPTAIRFQLSSGEQVLLSLLGSMTWARGCEFEVCDLAGLSDDAWDRVITSLFLLRGRVIAA